MTRRQYNPPDQIAGEHCKLDNALINLSRSLRLGQLQGNAENGVQFTVETTRGVITKLTAVVKGADGASPYEGKYQRGEHIWLDVVIGQDTDVLGAKQRIKDALEACLAASNQESIQAAAK